jgi:hypothetical protein
MTKFERGTTWEYTRDDGGCLSVVLLSRWVFHTRVPLTPTPTKLYKTALAITLRDPVRLVGLTLGPIGQLVERNGSSHGLPSKSSNNNNIFSDTYPNRCTSSGHWIMCDFVFLVSVSTVSIILYQS